MIGMETEQGYKNTGGALKNEPHAQRVQLWLAPFRSQVEEGYEALKAAFEDDQHADGFTPVGAHLLVAMAAALGKMHEVHPAILELTRTSAPGAVGNITTPPDFSGGPMYVFQGSTPADTPNPKLWEKAKVVTTLENNSLPLYKYRDNRAGMAIVNVNDRRFRVYTGRTEPIA